MVESVKLSSFAAAQLLWNATPCIPSDSAGRFRPLLGELKAPEVRTEAVELMVAIEHEGLPGWAHQRIPSLEGLHEIIFVYMGSTLRFRGFQDPRTRQHFAIIHANTQILTDFLHP